MTEPNTEGVVAGAESTTTNTDTAVSENQDGGISLSLGNDDAAVPGKAGADDKSANTPQIPEGYFKIPGEDATDEDRAAYRAAIGVPETPEKYLEGIDGLPDGYAAPDWLTELAHSQNMPTATFQAMIKADAENSAKYMAELQDAAKKEQQATASALKKEWGKDAPANITLAQRAVNHFAKDIDGFGDFMKKNGLDQNPAFIKFAHKVATEMGESAFVEGDKGKQTGREKDTAEVLYPNETRKG